MAFPFVGHHDASEIGMSAEPDTEEIEDLSLIEVSRRPDWGDAVDLRIEAVHWNRQAHSRLQTVRNDVIDDLEARFGRVVVHTGDIFEEVIAGLLYDRCGGADMLAGDLQRELGVMKLCVQE